MTRARTLADLGSASLATDAELVTATSAVQTSKNAITNGAMQIWQRGTTFNTLNTYSADRWMTNSIATVTTSRQPATGLDGFQYCLRMQRTAGNSTTSDMNITQSLESVNSVRFQGKTATLSFYCRAGADFSPPAIYINVREGTGTDQNVYTAGYTGSTVLVSQSFVPTTSWVRYSFTMNVSSSCNEIGLWTVATTVGTAGANDWYEITGVQLEVGDTATDFEHKPFGVELAECQRYYQTSSNFGTHSLSTTQTLVAAAATFLTGFRFPVAMRTAPTVTAFSRNNNQNKVSSINTGLDAAGDIDVINVGANQVWAVRNTNSTFSVGQGYEISYNANAEL